KPANRRLARPARPTENKQHMTIMNRCSRPRSGGVVARPSAAAMGRRSISPTSSAAWTWFGCADRWVGSTDMSDRKVGLKMVLSLDGFATSPDGTHQWMFEWCGDDSGEWTRRALEEAGVHATG